MSNTINYPEKPMDFIRQYSFTDTEEVPGTELVPVFRVEQMLEHYYDQVIHKMVMQRIAKLLEELSDDADKSSNNNPDYGNMKYLQGVSDGYADAAGIVKNEVET